GVDLKPRPREPGGALHMVIAKAGDARIDDRRLANALRQPQRKDPLTADHGRDLRIGEQKGAQRRPDVLDHAASPSTRRAAMILSPSRRPISCTARMS